MYKIVSLTPVPTLWRTPAPAVQSAPLPAEPLLRSFPGPIDAPDDFAALQKAPAKALSDERKAKQVEVDAAITAKGTLEKYLKARFSLSKGSKPHAMAF